MVPTGHIPHQPWTSEVPNKSVLQVPVAARNGTSAGSYSLTLDRLR